MIINHEQSWSSLVGHTQPWIKIGNPCSTRKTMVMQEDPAKGTMTGVGIRQGGKFINVWFLYV